MKIEAIAGTGGGQTGRTGVTYATPELPLPAPVIPRKLSKAKRSRDQRLKRFRRDLRKVAPELDNPRFAPLINGFGRASILASDAYEVLRHGGLLNADGELRSSVTILNQLLNSQLKFARELGLSPSAMSKIKREKPDLAAAFAAVEIEDASE